jgi:hypothetical protein
MAGNTTEQLRAIADVNSLLDGARIDHWLFGGWAVDFYVGAVTRPHDDIDIAVWQSDFDQITALLAKAGWIHGQSDEDNGGTGFERGEIRLELTFLVRRDDGLICILLNEGPVPWDQGGFGHEVRQLEGARARVMGLEQLTIGKSHAREDEEDALKDRADHEALSRLDL